MAKRFTSTPDVPRIDGGVTIFRSCLVSRRVPGRRVVHQVALRALRHRVHGQPGADLLHRPRLLLRPHAHPDHRRHRRAQRLRRRRRRAPRDELPLLHLLRDQQEGAQHPRRARLPRRDQRGARPDRPRVRRPRRLHRAAQAHPRDPVGRPRQRPRAHPPPPRRHQGRHAPRLPLLQGLPGRDAGQQRELHGAGGDAHPRRRRLHRRLQREADALRGRLPQPLRQPVDLGRGDAEEAAPAGRGERRRARAHVPQLPHPVRPLQRHHLREHRRGVPVRAPARAAAPRAGAGRRPREGRRRPDALPGRRAVPRAHRRPAARATAGGAR